MRLDLPEKRQEPTGDPAPESRFERRAWIVVYVVVVLFLAAGAARRIWAMF